jgi:D-alanyl-lipoteichoic acid acyltransferase DltB (MBOAT superfamily)
VAVGKVMQDYPGSAIDRESTGTRALPAAANFRSFGDALVPTLCKLVFVATGLGGLAWLSRGLAAPALLLTAVLLTWVAARAVEHRSLTVRRGVARAVVPGMLLTIVLLNVTGLIGTLTGASASLVNSSVAFLAAPFYLLAASAVVADVATGRIKMPSLLDHLTYVALPFKLLAGPLETPDMIARLSNFRPSLSWARAATAWSWIVLGLFMKLVIANRLDPAGRLGAIDPLGSLATATVFELKFYFDFAGYSFMAHGLALAIGLRMTHNFNHPFFAPNVVIFWRRWHMSLGRFLTRYFMEPNVTKLKGRNKRMLFTSSIFLASAMWHGGTGNYLLWGLFHAGVYFAWIAGMKKRSWPDWAGVPAMLAFFVLGRFLAIDADWSRMAQKIAGLFNPMAWIDSIANVSSVVAAIEGREQAIFGVIALFLLVEGRSVARYGANRSYHLLRRPLVTFALLLGVLFLGVAGGAPLYARF